MQYYDVHSHIVPGFDDGAKDVKVSLQLLESLKSQNVMNVCLTSHFYSNEMSVEDYVYKRNLAFQRLSPHIPEGMKVILGAEVYVTKFLFSNSTLNGITYGNSKYILTEYPYDADFSQKTLQNFYMLIENYGLIPVMPHVERYAALMDNPGIISELQDSGVLIQTNIGNYTKNSPFFRKRKLLKYIKEGLIDLIGSDTHSMHHNSPTCFAEALKTISDKCGEEHVERMMKNAKKIFDAAL